MFPCLLQDVAVLVLVACSIIGFVGLKSSSFVCSKRFCSYVCHVSCVHVHVAVYGSVSVGHSGGWLELHVGYALTVMCAHRVGLRSGYKLLALGGVAELACICKRVVSITFGQDD